MMRNGKALAALGLVGASFSAAALAQAAPSDTINVIGRKPEEVREEAKAFVRKIAVANRPVSRFVDPVCPFIVGLDSKLTERLETRLRAIAKDAGARVAKAPCKPNLTLAFATNTDAVIDEVVARTPGLFEESGLGLLTSIKRSDAPIRWWHTTDQRTKDGMRSGGNEAPPATVRAEQPGGTPMGGQVHQQYRSSFLSSQMVRALTSATIVVDVDRAKGVPLDSVAAFGGLVGLAEIRFDDEAPPNSILGLFQDDGARDLTTLDTTFLRTLYKLPLDRTAIAHRGLLIRGLTGGETKKAER